MHEDIRSFLADSATLTVSQTMAAAFELFDRIGFNDYEEGYIELVMTDDMVDIGDTVLHMVDLTRKIQDQILLEHGVVLQADTFMGIANDIIGGILDIQEYENAVDILQTVDLRLSPEEVFAELIALVAPHTADEILTHLDSVSVMFIAKLRAMAKQRDYPELPNEDRETQKKMVQQLVRLVASSHQHDFEIVKMIKAGVAVGLPFATYTSMIGKDFDAMDARSCSYELVGCALVSSDGHNNPVIIIKNNLEHLLSDLSVITKVSIQVADIMAVQTT